jgi:hypothetical protein
MNDKFTKLSELVDDEFTVEKVDGYKFKKWDNEARKMLIRDDFEQGFRKVYAVETDKGKLDLGTGQIGSLLEGVMHAGKADLIGVTFAVKSNGKSGMDIRYYFNPQRQKKVQEEVPYEDLPEGF